MTQYDISFVVLTLTDTTEATNGIYLLKYIFSILEVTFLYLQCTNGFEILLHGLSVRVLLPVYTTPFMVGLCKARMQNTL